MDEDQQQPKEQPAKRVEIGQAEEIDLADSLQYELSGPGGPHFEWKSYLDLLSKARRDLAEIRAKGVDSDRLFNFLATTAHIYDWIVSDPQIPSALKSEAERMVHPKPSDPIGAVTITYRLCTRAKHMVLTHSQQPPPTKVQRSGWGTQPWGTSPWGGGLSYQVEVDGSMRNVLDLGQDAIVEWESLLTKHGLPIQ